jgi:deazaflavin-dependent oxidoreductase (nitroreductase family)
MVDWIQRNKPVIEEFRVNGGRVDGQFESMEMLLLTTTGARSGQRRTSPLAYLMDGERFIVLAATGGAPNHPAWYYNLVAHPRATVEVGSEIFDVTATVITDGERDELLAKIMKRYPQVIGYREKTSRQFPVIALQR